MPLAAWDGAVETAAKAAGRLMIAQALTGRRDAQRSPLPICTGPRHLKRRNTVRPRALRGLAVVEHRKALRRSWPVLARLVLNGETERRLRLAALRTPRLPRGPFPRATAGQEFGRTPRRHNNRGDAAHPHIKRTRTSTGAIGQTNHEQCNAAHSAVVPAIGPRFQRARRQAPAGTQ